MLSRWVIWHFDRVKQCIQGCFTICERGFVTPFCNTYIKIRENRMVTKSMAADFARTAFVQHELFSFSVVESVLTSGRQPQLANYQPTWQSLHVLRYKRDTHVKCLLPFSFLKHFFPSVRLLNVCEIFHLVRQMTKIPLQHNFAEEKKTLVLTRNEKKQLQFVYRFLFITACLCRTGYGFLIKKPSYVSIPQKS